MTRAPQALGHLGEEEAGATGSGVDEDCVAGLDGVGGVSEVVGGHALEDGGGGLLDGDVIGNRDEAAAGATASCGVGAGNEAPGDAVAGFDRW